MGKGRLEAFSDGVIAVIITVMVLEMKVPHGADFEALRPVLPVFASYVLSFVYIGIYWNNHHHMLRAADHIDGRSMWANLHLLFWLSLVPFLTGWLGENHSATLPTAVYGFVLIMAAVAYTLLQASLVACNGRDSTLARAVGHDVKGKVSLVAYLLAVAFAFVRPWISDVLFVAVAVMWFVPDPRIERTIAGSSDAGRPR